MAGENGANDLSNQVQDLSVNPDAAGIFPLAAALVLVNFIYKISAFYLHFTGDADASTTAAERSLLQKVIRRGLVENKNDLEIQRKDPKSPLYSVKSFEALNLKSQLLKGILYNNLSLHIKKMFNSLFYIFQLNHNRCLCYGI